MVTQQLLKDIHMAKYREVGRVYEQEESKTDTDPFVIILGICLALYLISQWG